MAHRELRPHQQIACSRVRSEWQAGITRTAIVHPTGCGKTDIIASLCLGEIAARGRVLILVHRAELVDQLIERIQCYSPIPVGRIQGSHNDLNHSITIASVQTLSQQKRRQEMSWRPTLVVIDEVHHALAESYLTLAEWAGCFDQRQTKLLGLTATLTRSDHQSFNALFESIADVMTPREALRQNLLVPPVIKPIHLDKWWDRYTEVFHRLTDFDYEQRDIERTVHGWLRKGQNRLTIAYAPSVQQAEQLTEAFQNAGVPVALVTGTTPYEDRKLIYKQLDVGEIRVMINVGIATEGFNSPHVSCILLTRWTESPGLLTQMIGRGLRPCIDTLTGKPWIDPVTNNAKTNCLVLDTVGVTEKFRLTPLIALDKSRIRTRSKSRLRKIWDALTIAEGIETWPGI